MPQQIRVYGDNLIEAAWFINLTPLLANAKYETIKNRGQNPPKIEALISYDRPDLILEIDGEPVDKTKLGENAGVCNMNVRFLLALEKISVFHGVPILAVEWPHDSDYQLVVDGTEDAKMTTLVHNYITSGYDKTLVGFQQELAANSASARTRLAARKSYGKPPPSVKILNTAAWLRSMGIPSSDATARALLQRQDVVVYKAGMTPEKCKRQDPYTGMQFLYDYLYCRTGPLPSDKQKSLVLWFPILDKATWFANNPNNLQAKGSNWYLTANAFLFSDGLYLLRP